MEQLFQVRLNCVDHYQSVPTRFDPLLQKGDGSSQKKKEAAKVPIIRVFGATETGQKVCAHIHGAFPYMYIEYKGSLKPEDVDSYIHHLHLSIDHALAVSYRRNSFTGQTTFVAHVSLVKGVPFYGFHVGYRYFLKIYLLNPLHMTRLADLLRQGAIMMRPLQPFESHMQYLLQWMCDYNLYGCAYINCRKLNFRGPVPQYLDMESSSHLWHDRTIPLSMLSEEDDDLPRLSHCDIEVDICVQDIINREEIQERPVHHFLQESFDAPGSGEKLVHSMAGLWRDETRRRKARMGDSNPGSSPFPPEVLVSVSADPRNTDPGGWIHEEEYRSKIADIMMDERLKDGDDEITFESFVQTHSSDPTVRTAFQSVENLFPINLPTLETSQQRLQDEPLEDEIQVDESRIFGFEITDGEYASDEGELPAEPFMPKHGVRLDGSPREMMTGKTDQAIKAEPIKNGLSSPALKGRNTYEDRLMTVHPGGPNEDKDPMTLDEMRTHGIRDANDYSHMDEDAFEPPDETLSDLSSAIARHKRAVAVSMVRETPRKRRRLSNGSIEIHSDNSPSSMPKTPTKSQVLIHGTTATKTSIQSNGAGVWAASEPIPDVHRRSLSPRLFNQSPSPYASQASQRLNGSPTTSNLRREIQHTEANPLHRSYGHATPSQSSSNFLEKLHTSISSPTKPSKFPSGRSRGSPKSIPAPSGEAIQKLQSVALEYNKTYSLSAGNSVFCFASSLPPSTKSIASFEEDIDPPIIYRDAHYSNEIDVPERARLYAGREFKLEGITAPYLPEFDPSGRSMATHGEHIPSMVDKVLDNVLYERHVQNCNVTTWEFEIRPPSRREVQTWLDTSGLGEAVNDVADAPSNGKPLPRHLSQIDGPTQKNRHGFRYSQKQSSTSVQHEAQYMSLMSLEVHVNTRGNLVPNPEQDKIACVFWCVQSDDEELEVNGNSPGTHVGILVLSEPEGLARKIALQTSVEVEQEENELDVITKIVDIVRRYDPDVLTGFEVHGGSWGYIIERARCKYEYNLCDELSRMKSQSHGRFGKDDDRWGFNHTSTIRVTGRHTINVWRAMRGELNLLQYTMENIVFHVLHRRVPHFAFSDLTTWYTSSRPRDLAKVVDYFINRVQLDLEILEQNELIPRTSEQARLLGVDFFSVFSRGSQFKVESLMFRIAKPENLILISPSRKQVGQQNALECLPLVMEPQSSFFTSPLLVLDFQSLYPSIMIAYNYCYSTYLGRVVQWRGQNKMGFTNYERQPRVLEILKDHINIAPNGIVYVRPEIRKSLLAKMLGEILETRVMVKSGMKADKDDKTLQRLLNNRQLALKLIANVTYGYTSASFSGRMPCSEIADSIVQSGRETLEKAIALIHSVERWGAEVVYGDTDSLFVYLKGRTKDQAFDIGNEIAKTITDLNPRPVKLKFEKVYFPCVLLAKKRYVGFKYESKTQQIPDFDAKGIETVRRDGTPAEQKIEEKALKILFRTADLSAVKAYFQKQCTKIMRGNISIQDFCFAREVKLGTYSDKGPPPPGALISTKRMLEDPRAEPQYGERVPYVVITGAPGARLIDRCVAPDVLLQNEHMDLDAEYYISKNLIPPLERIFNLAGANVRHWYDEMPKYQRTRRIDRDAVPTNLDPGLSKKTLESYLKSSSCIVCSRKLEEEQPICQDCASQPAASLAILRSQRHIAEKRAVMVDLVCRSCANLPFAEEIKCDSKDCPVFYTRKKNTADLRSSRVISEPVVRMLEERGTALEEW
ncbi:DNA polymerase zeta [Agyrium rufum]|nr:DNA polymerase zeta [Agyrium rufum]